MTNAHAHSIKLGEPLPNSKHAVSVSLPTWADVKGYEEADPRVVNAMKTGYPRFVYNPILKKTFAECEKRFANENEFCLVFPTLIAAQKAVKFCNAGRINQFADGIWAVAFPKGLERKAKEFWMHTGLIVSSRQAEAALEGKHEDKIKGDVAKKKLKEHLSRLTHEKDENIYLFQSGMAAIFTAFEITQNGRSTIQLGFPYVDTLKIQEKFGKETFFIIYKDEDSLKEVEEKIKTKKVSAIFTEFPCNPLITCVEVEKLSKLCKENGVALIVDDTLASFANVDLKPYADIIVSSLTKFYSGVGDVLAGSLVLNSNSPLFAELKKKLDAGFEDMLFADDAEVLEKNGRDYEKRIRVVNENAEQLADWLRTRNEFQHVYYAKGDSTYEKYKKLGYGGIISLVLPTEEQAQRFFDALDVKKGPSLGTNYTLACPYTMLAHYYEKELIDRAGVAFQLVRVSVGLEEFDELKQRFEAALRAI